MDIITRAAAKAAGLTRYYTGKPCRRGHYAPREVAGAYCVTCRPMTNKQNGALPATLKRNIVRQAMNRARDRGRPVDKDAILALFPSPPICPVFGTEFEYGRGDGRPGAGPRSLTLDAIRPADGYVAGNMELVSFKANVAKNSLTPKELLQLVVHCYLSRGQEAKLMPRLAGLMADWKKRNKGK